jgi:ABC-2 type transport system permease protein
MTSDALRNTFVRRTAPRPPGAVTVVLAFATRTLWKIRHNPQQLFDAVFFPIVVTLVFTYLFGGALAGSTHDYLQYLQPGVLVLAVSLISMNTGVALNVDVTKGIFDRFRSLPIWRPAVLVGALLGDTLRYASAATVSVLVGLVLGFRPAGGVGGVVLGVLLIVLFAFSFSWVWTTMGLLARKPETVMSVSGLALLPLTFLSNLFVDTHTMPGWLSAAVQVNPVTHVVAAVRGLMSGTATAGQAGAALLACVVLIAVFGVATGVLYRRQSEGEGRLLRR